MSTELKRLFTPLSIKGLQLPNRVIMPALNLRYTPDGRPAERFNAFYWRRAEGGVGLTVVGGCLFCDDGGGNGMLRLCSDDDIPSHRAFVAGMHARGALTAVQLYHGGRYVRSSQLPAGMCALAPSAVSSRYTGETPRAMTLEDIHRVQQQWIAAAVRAMEAGYDAVEIIASAGYLISQFLSPLTNRREDEYGGTFENRARFACELIRGIRRAAGNSFPLFIRISGNDFVSGSNTGVDAVAFARMAEAAGVDMISVTGGWHETTVPQISGDVPPAGLGYLAAAVHDAVTVPVALGNRVDTPVTAERLLALGMADLVCLARPQVADPDWTRKSAEGRADEIRPCLACNQGCLARVFHGQPLGCLVNADAGMEYLQMPEQASTARRILVIGAGPAGCAFAVTAAARGHQVTVWEQEEDVGGQLLLAARPPSKSSFMRLVAYYRTMLRRKGITLCTGMQASAENIAAADFDLVVTATGMIPKTVQLPGRPGMPVLTAYDVLSGRHIAGRDVVIIGGGSVGCETAQYLAREGAASDSEVCFLLGQEAESPEFVHNLMNTSRRKVTLVDVVKIGSGFEPGTAWPLMQDLKRLRVTKYPFTRLVDVREQSVLLAVTDRQSGAEASVEVPCDTLILAVGGRPANTLYVQLKERGVAVYAVGDSCRIGKVSDAVSAGVKLAREI